MAELIEPMHPKEWRLGEEFSLAQVAVLVGIRGKGARATYQKYERGENHAPFEIIDKIEKLSEGKVTFKSWLGVRRAWLATHSQTEPVAA